MQMILRAGLFILVVALMNGCSLGGNVAAPYTVILDRLDEPRGLWLAENGVLCVAEAGRLPEGEVVNENRLTVQAETGALTCVNEAGVRARVVDGLPYVLYSASGESVGPADVAEMDGVRYLLTGEGYGGLSRKLLRLESAAAPSVVADFIEFAAQGKPLAYFKPSSIAANPFAMLADPAHGRFLVTDGATGQVLSADLSGKITVYSPAAGHEVLTGIAWGPDRLVYVASFSQLPHAEGAGSILRLHPDGYFETAIAGVTTPIDIAFDRAGRLYVLEFVFAGQAADPYREKSGRLLRFHQEVGEWSAPQVLVEGIPYPTAMLFDAEDRLYMSVWGAFSAPQTGMVVRFDDLFLLPPDQPPLQLRPTTPSP